MKAYFIVHGEDLRSEERLKELAGYDVLVCSLSLNPEDVRSRLNTLKNWEGKLLCYLNLAAIQLSGPNNPIKKSLRKRMGLTDNGQLRESWASTWYFLSNNEPERDAQYDKLVYLRPVLDAYDEYAIWIMGNCMGWDGWYLDYCWENLPPRIEDLWIHYGIPHQDRRWVTVRDYFLRTLSEYKPLVGNIGRSIGMFPRHLSGITIESDHTNTPIALALFHQFSMGLPDDRENLSIYWGSGMERFGVVMKGVRG